MQKTKRTKILLLITITLFWFAQYVYVPFHTPYLLFLGASSAFVGIIVGTYGLAQMFFRIPVGMLADRRGRYKGLIIAGFICAVLASLLRLVFPVPAAFLAANLLSGITSSSWVALTVFYSSLYSEEELKKATGHVMASNNAGILLGFVVSMFVADNSGVWFVFAVSMGAALLGLVTIVFVKEIPPVQKPLEQTPLKSIMTNKTLVYYSLLALVLQAVVLSTALSFTTSYAEQLTSAKVDISLCMIIFEITTVFSSLLVGHLRRVSANAIVCILFGGLTLSCFFIPLSAFMTELYFWQGIAGLANGGIITLVMAFALQGVDRAYKATVMGTFQALYAVGMTLGPMLMGTLVDAWGYTAGYWGMALLPVAAAAAIVIRSRVQKMSQNSVDSAQRVK